MSSNNSKKPPSRPRRDLEKPSVSKEYEGHIITGPDEDSVREAVSSMEREKARRARWPEDGKKAMAQLARLFPTMRDVPGTDPWNADALIDWCNSGAPTSGSGWAARFLLSVWNPGTDWTDYGLPAPGKFDLMEAWAVWDEDHWAAALEWLHAPFWP